MAVDGCTVLGIAVDGCRVLRMALDGCTVLGIAVDGCRVLRMALDGCTVLGMTLDALNEAEGAASESGLYTCLWSPGTHRTRGCVGPIFDPHAVEKKKNPLPLPEIQP